jgi:excisionase family DNA binding protein
MRGDRTVLPSAAAPTAVIDGGESLRDYYTVDELVDRLGISVRTAYDKARRGLFEFPVRKVGRQYRIPKRSFDRWLAGEDPETTASTPATDMVAFTVAEADRLRDLLANASRVLQRFEQAAPWLQGGLHYSGGLLAAARDLERRVLDVQFTGCAGIGEFPIAPGGEAA